MRTRLLPLVLVIGGLAAGRAGAQEPSPHHKQHHMPHLDERTLPYQYIAIYRLRRR